LLEIPIGRRNQSHVDACVLVVTDAPKFLRLEDTQQLDLKSQRHLPDLVEEQRARMCLRKQTLAILGGVSKRSSDMPKQLVLEQVLGNRGAVHDDERRLVAMRQRVQRSRHQLLAGAALTGDRNRDVGRRNHRDSLVELLDPRTAADDDIALARSALGSVAGARALERRAVIAQRTLEAQLELRAIERLGDEIECAEAHRLDGNVAGLAAGHDDDARLDALFAQSSQHVDSAHARHVVVEQHDVESVVVLPRIDGDRHRVLTGGHRRDIERRVVEQARNLASRRRLVIYYQQSRRSPGHAEILQ
jgi:hypothetical protein